MATYYVNSGAAGTNTGGSWTNAFNANPGAFAAALAAATTNGDIILVHKAHVEELAVDTTFPIGANISIICVDKDASDAPSIMAATTWIGNSTTFKSVSFSGAFRAYFYGLTFRIHGGTSKSMALGLTDGSHYVYESCYLWQGNTNASSTMSVGGQDSQVFIHLKNTTIRFGATGSTFLASGRVLMEGVTLSSAGTAPTILFDFDRTDPGGSDLVCLGCDFSFLGSGTLLGDLSSVSGTIRMSQCKLGAAFSVASILATQTHLNRAGGEVYLFDCATDGANGLFAYVNAMGSVWSDTGVYVTAGAAAQSWKITTTANCSLYTPFETPWISWYNTDTTTAIEPYLEFLRNNDGTTSTYDNDEVWIDVTAKTVSSTSQQSALFTDRITLLGTPAAQTSSALGAGDWSGETGTCAYGVIKAPSLTPAESGHIMARVCVGIEITGKLHVDPQIRT